MAGGCRGFLAGLLLGAAEAASAEELLVPAQYYGPPPRRGHRCWVERRPVIFYDRFGHPRRCVVVREVCR